MGDLLDPATLHRIEITLDPLSPGEQAEYDASTGEDREWWDRERRRGVLICPEVDGSCPLLWLECEACSSIGRPSPLTDDDLDQLDQHGELHGVEHRQADDGYWCIPTTMCWLQHGGDTADLALQEFAASHEPGTHYVDDGAADGEHIEFVVIPADRIATKEARRG